jgi:hypothetical protein
LKRIAGADQPRPRGGCTIKSAPATEIEKIDFQSGFSD